MANLHSTSLSIRDRRGAFTRPGKYSAEDMAYIVDRINAYRRGGASLGIACCQVGIGEETYRRWLLKIRQQTCSLVDT